MKLWVETKVQNKELIQHAAYAAIERILNEYFREENLYIKYHLKIINGHTII